MIPGEKIDTFFTRFTDIGESSHGTWKGIHSERVGFKALWSLKGTEWKNKRNAIEEGKISKR